MRAFMKFNHGILKMSRLGRLWVFLLLTVNLIVPLFFLGRPEAQMTVVILLASMMLMTALTATSGFTRLLGLGHILWVPLLWFFWTRLAQVPSDTFFGIWLRVGLTVNALSLVIETADVIRYIAGDRAETVEDPA